LPINFFETTVLSYALKVFLIVLVLQVSRGGQSVTLFGTSLVIFGGEDAKRTLLNDLHILDLETMTWDEIDAV
jgi:hypothetical protein